MGHGRTPQAVLTDVVPTPSVLVITFGTGTPHTCIAWGPGDPVNPASHSWRQCVWQEETGGRWGMGCGEGQFR